MKLNLSSYPNITLFSGNAGTAGTAQQNRGSQRSRIKHKSGNKGTQLCLIESLPPYLVPAQKTPGTGCHAERPVLEPLYPRSRVPTDFEFSRVNKGGYVLFLLTELEALVPSFSPRPIPTSNQLSLIADSHHQPWPASACNHHRRNL